MNIPRPYVVLLILVLTAAFIVGCTSQNAAPTVPQTVAQTVAPGPVSETPMKTVPLPAAPTIVPVPDDVSAKKAAVTTAVPVTTVQPTPGNGIITFYSYSWIRNCPDPPGGQEYYSCAYDGGYYLCKYDSCSGGYHEWSNIERMYHPEDEPYKSGNQSIDDAFNIMIKAFKSVVVTTDNSTSEQNKKILNSAFENAVSVLSKGGEKGEFVNTPVTLVTDPKIIEGLVVNITKNNESSITSTQQHSCRCYSQYTSSYEIRTCICPYGVFQQWIHLD